MQETKGLVEAVIVVKWPPPPKAMSGGRLVTEPSGDLMLVNAGPRAQIQKGNFFNDYAKILNKYHPRGSKPPTRVNEVDRLTIVDATGDLVYTFRRDANTGEWTGEVPG